MIGFLTPLLEPLQHAFMRNAVAAIVLVGIICGAIGGTACFPPARRAQVPNSQSPCH